ncbi:protein FAM102A-like [Schistocerca americana]|uniref:protein FAM102A-like n=1 Tax=Schistocerca americana TaxID=7009 RepID=UPI001F4F8D58|nr:protein FAM102A-like [Schistocerca americana]
MAFMLQRKKYYKFQVEICVEELTAVPFINAVLFAKVRLLNGGGFTETSSREEVREHTVQWAAKFQFDCKMTANASTGVLNPCILRISVRREVKGGRSFQKLGFCNVNLAEFAGCGEIARRYLLEGYGTHQRQDNSVLGVSIKMNLLSGDILFKVPSASAKPSPVTKQDNNEADSCERGATLSSGPTAKSVTGVTPASGSLSRKRLGLTSCEIAPNVEPVVKEGDRQIEIVSSTENGEYSTARLESGPTSSSVNNNTNLHTVNGYSHHRWHSSPKIYRHARNSSTGFCFNETSGLDETSSLDRRKKAEHGIIRDSNSGSGIDADSLIDELIRSTIHDQPNENDENLGLQLFIAKDGSTTLGTPKTRSQVLSGSLKEVVVKSNQN